MRTRPLLRCSPRRASRGHAVVLLAALAVQACHSAMPPDQAIAELKSPDSATRQHAADSLRTSNGVPANAVPALIAAVQTEQDPHARGAMLITLGKSGAPEAKPIIDQAVTSAADPDTRRWSARALKGWMLQTGKLPADYSFPDGWPYGQPGYPPPLAK